MHQVNVGYTLLMLGAIATCSLLLRKTQKQLPISAMEKFGLGIGAFCGAMIGSKLPFLLSDWDGLVSGTAWFSNGKTIMFGIVGGYFGVEIAKWMMEIKVKTGDTFAAPVAFAVAIGRVACFQGGCCYGTPTNLPWGVVFPTALDGSTLARHPTQLYEAAFHFTAGLLLVWLGKRERFSGQLIKLYLLSYLVYRFLTEFIRPEAPVWFGLTGYQAAAVALVPLFAWLWWRDRNSLLSKQFSVFSEPDSTSRAEN
jgi:phosphatidylglycerol:prolipoprotein diacylglycerol transferase